MSKELIHSNKDFVNIKSTDDKEFLKWCLVKNLHPVDKILARIRIINKDFSRELDFKLIKFSVKTRDIHEVEKKDCIRIIVFGYQNKEKFPFYVSKNTFKRHFDLVLIEKEGQSYHFLTK